MKIDKSALLAKGASSQKPAKGESHDHFLARLTHLSLDNKGIDKIENLHWLVSLRVLYLYDNRISVVENLGFALNLTHLYLQNNSISIIKDLGGCRNLTKLYLDSNELSGMSELTGCTQLEELHIANQKVPMGSGFDLDPDVLQSMAGNLRVLVLAHNGISDPSPLGALFRLNTLNLSKNEILNFDLLANVLSQCTELRELDVRDNPVSTQRKIRDSVVLVSPNIATLDGKEVTPREREFLSKLQQRRSRSVDKLR